MPEITHANQVRGEKFKQMMRGTKTWIWIGLLVVALAAIGGAINPPLAAAGAALGLLVGVGIAFAVADNRAEDAFYESYAGARGLEWKGSGDLDGVVPLLRKGDKRKADEIFTGQLADGLNGTLALWHYTEVTRDHKGNRQETDYPFTLVITEIPESRGDLPELLLRRKSGLKALEKLEDAFRANHDRVTLESEAMRDRYEIFVRKDQDPVFVRRLFSPSFIVWLVDTPPKKYSFELVGGHLCSFVPSHREDVEGFDEMIAVTAAVADRIRLESTGA